MEERDDIFPEEESEDIELEDSMPAWAPELDDEFDRLREATARSSEVYNEMDVTDEGSAGLLTRFSPAQRLILALLFFLLVIVYGAALLLLTGII
jgi:hypothetical protein